MALPLGRSHGREAGVPVSAEFDYFGNPHISKLVDLLLQMAAEVHVTTHRLQALEMLLVRSGTLTEGQLDTFEPNEAERQLMDGRLEQMQGRLLRIIVEAGPAEHPLREQWTAVLERENG